MDGEEVVGSSASVPEAWVRGQVEEARTCDVGVGIRPDRSSQVLASAVLPAALRFSAVWVRAASASFDERSSRLCTSAGSHPVRSSAGPDGRPFVEMDRDLP